MKSPNGSSLPGTHAPRFKLRHQPIPWETVRCPGLTPSAAPVRELAAELPKRLAAFSYKLIQEYAWVVFVGGTGTGKSTIYNAVCGKPLSQTGVERPKTYGPILYAHSQTPIEEDFPFPGIRTLRFPADDIGTAPHSGFADQFLVLEHARDDLAHLVLVDTPDLDSLETQNRQLAEDLYLLSDVVVFVTSQEKYADAVPHQFLRRIVREHKPCLLLLNKAEETLTREEVSASLNIEGQDEILAENRFWRLPYAPSHPVQWISGYPEFNDFVSTLFKVVSQEEMGRFLAEERTRRSGELISRINRLLDLLEKEDKAAREWIGRLDELYRTACLALIGEQEKLFASENREYLQVEIRKLFSRYDILAKPRRYIAQLVRSPLQLLGLVGSETRKHHRDDLKNVRHKIELGPVQHAIERFNRTVLEKLSPKDETSPLYTELRRPGLTLDYREIREQLLSEQAQLAAWLEDKFQKLAEGIPKSKEWGIYSTSILWGVLILSFEATVGGGIGVVQAALDTALAPFVTRGAVELFAYNEVQRVAGELTQRYQKGLLSVVGRQRDRYLQALEAHMTRPETLEALRSLRHTLEVVQSPGEGALVELRGVK